MSSPAPLLNLLPDLDFKDPLRGAPLMARPAPPAYNDNLPRSAPMAIPAAVLTPPNSRPVSPARMMFSALSLGMDTSGSDALDMSAKLGCHNLSGDLDDINVSDLLGLSMPSAPRTPPESPMRVPAWVADEKPRAPGLVQVPVLVPPPTSYDSFDSLLDSIVPSLSPYATPYATPYASDAEDMLRTFSPEASPIPQAVPELPTKRRRRSIKRHVVEDEVEEDDDDDYIPSELAKSRRRQAGNGKRKGSRRARARDMNSKRDSHNVSERHRRKELKLSFEALRTSVPCMEDNPRVHTGTILNNALDFIKELEQEERELIAQKEALIEENARLKAARGL